ncbi:MAG: GNAT family acetyltransferase [Verrucomicrobiota bacterium]
MKIRPYQDSDQQALVQLWFDCGLVAPHNNPIRDIQRKLKVNPEWFLVALKEEKIVASCMVGYEGHRGWINYLAVAPSEQRKGYAKEIMAKAERLLREAGCPKINLQVRSSNSQVIEFYESIGFSDDQVTSLGKRLETDEPYHVAQGGGGNG